MTFRSSDHGKSLTRATLLLFVLFWSLAVLDFSLFAHRWDPRIQEFVHYRERFMPPIPKQESHEYVAPSASKQFGVPEICPITWLFHVEKEFSFASSLSLCFDVSPHNDVFTLPSSAVSRPVLAVAPKQSPPSV